MVFDNVKNAALYYGLGDRFRTALEWMARTDTSNFHSGDKIEIDGDQIFARYFEVDTKSPEGALPEAHEHYADIQWLLEGEEAVGYALKDGRAPAKPCDPEADIAFWDVPFDTIRLKPGDFYIVWPEDLHAPRLAPEAPSRVRVLVVKVRVD